MNKLEDGLNQLKDNEQAYLDGQGQLADAEEQLAAGEAKLAKGEADYAAAPAKLAAGKAAVASGEKELAAGKNDLTSARKSLDTLESNIEQLRTNFKTWEAGWQAANAPNDDLGGYSAVQAFSLEDSLGRIRTENVENNAIPGVKGKAAEEGNAMLNNLPLDPGDKQALIQGLRLTVPETADSIQGDLDTLVNAAGYSGDDPTALYIKSKLAPFKDTLEEKKTALSTSLAKMEALKGLEGGRDQLTSYFMQLVNTVTKNGTDKDMVDALGGASALKMVQQGLSDQASDAVWDGTVNSLFEKADKLVKEKEGEYAAGLKKYRAGQKKLAAGKAQYRQGLADYAAAPGQLAEGRQQLADGYKQYEDGKAQLAQYEDGEQQIRDGLATLFNTEADLDLESIADRLDGDGDFDNGDNHLEIDEGLNAVEVGRGYQAEDGDLITTEIMGRAVATGGLIGAAVLAVLAAILSFLKKNKGAAVFAILAAAAGAFGAFYGPAQGTYFSEIAGSTIGTLTWVAAGVLGAVALVHAIVHFAAPKNA